MAGQQAPGLLQSLPPWGWDYRYFWRPRFSVDAGDACVASTLLIVPFPSPIFHLFCFFLSTRPRYITEAGFTVLLLGVLGTGVRHHAWLKGERFLKALALLRGTLSHFRLSPWYTGSALASRASVSHALSGICGPCPHLYTGVVPRTLIKFVSLPLTVRGVARSSLRTASMRGRGGKGHGEPEESVPSNRK